MTETETKIVDIQLNYSEAVKGLAQYEVKMREAKQAQEELRKAMERGELTQEEYDKEVVATRTEITQLKNEQRLLQKELQNQVKAENEAAGSLNELRAQLSNLTAQYDALSAAQREGDIGQTLKDQINEVTTTLKSAEEGTQRFYRNVGNYTESVKAAFGSLDKELQQVKTDYEAAAAASEKATKEAEKAKEAYEAAAKAEGETSEKTSQLRKQYVDLSIAAKEAAKKAETLRAQMTTNEQAINATREATEKLYSHLIPFGNVLLPMLSRGLAGIKEGFALAAQGAKIVGKQLLALMANPIVAFLAAVAAAIALVVKGVKGSEENANKLSKILAPINMLLGALQTALEKVCGWILTGIEYAGKLAQLLGRVVQVATADIPLVGDAVRAANVAVEEAIKLEEREQQLTKDRRALLVEEAKRQREIAELRDKASDTTQKYADRLEALKKAIQSEEEITVERVRLAKEELAIAEEKAKQAPNSAEDEQKLAELRAKVYKEEEELFKQRKELNSQLNAIDKERKEKTAERVKKEMEAINTAEAEMRKLIADKNKRAIEDTKAQYNKEIEALKYRLQYEKNLTEKTREAINQTILAKEKQMGKEVDKLQKEQSKKRAEEELRRVENEYNELLQMVDRKNGVERTRLELELQKNRAAALQKGEEETTEQFRSRQIAAQNAILQAEQNFADAQKAQREKNRKEEAQSLANSYTERLMQAEQNEVERAQIEVEQRKQYLDNLHQMEEETDADFKARQLEAQQAYNDAQKHLAEQEVQVQQAKLQMMESLFGGFSKALAVIGEDNKTFAKLSKVLALGEIAVNTGKAIAAGVANAQAVGFPASIVATATTVATVLANMASAISTVKSAKFAAGAIGIGGAGTGTNDKIPAMISNGESVINAAATALFPNELAAINDIGRHVTPEIGGLTLNNAQPSLFGEQMREAVEEIHPVVYVEDINLGQKSVEVAEKRGVL